MFVPSSLSRRWSPQHERSRKIRWVGGWVGGWIDVRPFLPLTPLEPAAREE